MVSKSKVRRIGNSLGVVLPREVLSQLEASEGDTLVFTETAERGVQVHAARGNFDLKMKAVDDLCHRYRNALRELSK